MYIGVDLGGTNIAVGVVDENGKILHKRRNSHWSRSSFRSNR